MKLIAAFLAVIIIALLINMAMLARIERALSRPQDHALPVAAPLAQAPRAGVISSSDLSVPVDASTARDSATILAALEVVRRHRDTQGTDRQLVQFLRDIDPDAYFMDLATVAKTGKARSALQAIFYGDSDSSDPRYVPILATVGRRALAGGSSDDAMQVAGFVSRFDAPELRSILVAATQRWLEHASGNRHLDGRTARVLLRSGLPLAHAELVRWLIRSEHGDEERQRVHGQLRDLYLPIRKLPAIDFSRQNGAKLSDADKASLREFEEWIRENRRVLVYDPALEAMTLAGGAPVGAAPEHAQSEPGSATSPAGTPAPDSPKSEF